MSLPKDLKYTREHEWIRVNGSTATVGITDFAQSELGDLVYVEVDTVEDELEQNDVFGTVEAVKTTSELFMPVSGKVIAFNEELDEDEGDNPAIINEDPYDEGWIIKIELSDASELEELLSAEDYEEIIS
ncbi:MAG: glycine cleavage system protein GcvH [Bacteroidetes bacterium]|jgi:glycine cleavage system H protein|nr:glycine cleavage system protein GcvH [Bacteroidota bacterium]